MKGPRGLSGPGRLREGKGGRVGLRPGPCLLTPSWAWNSPPTHTLLFWDKRRAVEKAEG